MQIILRPRGTGKTTEIIRQCAEKGGYIVCKDLRECKRIEKAAREAGYSIPFPISFDEFLSKPSYGRNIQQFLIDDADLLLQRLARGAVVCVISLTQEE